MNYYLRINENKNNVEMEGGGAAAQQADTEMEEAPSDPQQPSAAPQAAGIENIPATLSHGGRFIRYNIFGNIFEVTAKYRPTIIPIGEGRIRHRLIFY
ncbi:mitogen-activated protein kinase 6-like [Mangifera indica]|uniref:mitogen-activated protein kinase 6-like n=1 Tax=Mangifera indica TaxID=29780 RepID=UPI001CF9EE37|nr:mitogen-activated protein kinase 6-like [Mangifera indica]